MTNAENNASDASFLDTEFGAAKPEPKPEPEAAKPKPEPEAKKEYVFVGDTRHDTTKFKKGDSATGAPPELIAHWLSHGVVKLKGE